MRGEEVRGEEVMGESRYDLTCPRPRCDFSRHRAHVMTFPDPRSRCDFSRSQAHVVFFSNPGRVVTFLDPREREPGRVMTSPNPGFASLVIA